MLCMPSLLVKFGNTSLVSSMPGFLRSTFDSSEPETMWGTAQVACCFSLNVYITMSWEATDGKWVQAVLTRYVEVKDAEEIKAYNEMMEKKKKREAKEEKKANKLKKLSDEWWWKCGEEGKEMLHQECMAAEDQRSRPQNIYWEAEARAEWLEEAKKRLLSAEDRVAELWARVEAVQCSVVVKKTEYPSVVELVLNNQTKPVRIKEGSMKIFEYHRLNQNEVHRVSPTKMRCII